MRGAARIRTADGEDEWRARKRKAVHAGLDFISTTGLAMLRSTALHARHGSDILLPFHVPRSNPTEEEAHALLVAKKLANEWRMQHCGKQLPNRCEPRQLLDLMQGLYALEELGLGDPVLTSQVAERCAKFNAVDFFKFDPLHTEPGAFVCEDCVCGARLDAESAHCTQCRRPAIRMSAYDVWLEALVFTFHGCRMGIGLGACFFDILRQLSTAFVAAHGKTLAQKDAHYLAYALTHVIYALSNFNERSLPPSLFPPPIRSCLLDRLKFALKKRDPDLAGECLDCLKCIGERGQTLNAAERFLVGSQQADGGWCCVRMILRRAASSGSRS
uniref:DUF6895 domain-containing protein n=1 Tax=Calcidiscus leptoporus TaxID=127549 RepID=A0A7S0J6L7_9EUKA|mmetsp:Transcript_42180/g.98783  ORF Transcript_42180/g.98783 Transcript_42180/m.98783 type:complete len:330 (+) Transcript_42180:108-1097(+)